MQLPCIPCHAGKKNEKGEGSSWLERVSYNISSYFVWDIIQAVRYIKYQGIGMVFHGIAGFVVIFFSYVSQSPITSRLALSV